MSRARRRRRAPRRRTTTWLVLALAVGLGSLFLMAWQTHEIHLLQADATRLSASKRFQEDQLRRLQVRWYQSTQREPVVQRAATELGLGHPGPEARQVVAIPGAPERASGPAWLRQVAAGLDRYGQIGGALARPELEP